MKTIQKKSTKSRPRNYSINTDIEAQSEWNGRLTPKTQINNGIMRSSELAKTLVLFQTQGQKKYSGGIPTSALTGYKILAQLKAIPNITLLNACLLDFYLAHPKSIPKKLIGKIICFWGTTYFDADGEEYIRCLRWSGKEPFSDALWLRRNVIIAPAAVLMK